MGLRLLLGTNNVGREIDASTTAALICELHDRVDGSGEFIVSVDCASITFVDSAAFHALEDATRYAARRGHSLVIRNLSPSCSQVLRFCDVAHELTAASSGRRA
jgi:anti-anti-sigma regulatory factor